METTITNIKVEDLTQLKKDIALIKNILIEETELTDWAKKQLDVARKTPRSEYINHEEVKKMILMK